jgi:hypothetical protein
MRLIRCSRRLTTSRCAPLPITAVWYMRPAVPRNAALVSALKRLPDALGDTRSVSE